MRYSVRDFLVSSLFQWLFREEHPVSGAKYAGCTFVQLLMNAVQAKDYYVKELLIFVKSLIPLEFVLLDRGFDTWGVITVLQELKLGHIILVPKYDNFKEW